MIQGGDEKAKGEVQIKDLILGAGLTAIKDRDEYLKKQAEAQFAVAEDKLVEAVRAGARAPRRALELTLSVIPGRERSPRTRNPEPNSEFVSAIPDRRFAASGMTTIRPRSDRRRCAAVWR